LRSFAIFQICKGNIIDKAYIEVEVNIMKTVYTKTVCMKMELWDAIEQVMKDTRLKRSTVFQDAIEAWLNERNSKKGKKNE
jgi:hypothetical protein